MSGEAVAEKNYSNVSMAFVYNNQKNDAFVDDLCLFKEGGNTSYTYDDWGRVLTVKNIADDGDKKTVYTYEVAYSDDAAVLPDGRVKSISYPDGTNESYTYDSAKRVKTYTDSNGVKTTYNYDSYGNLINSDVTNVNNNGVTLVGNSTSYTSNGNYADSVTDPFGNTTTTKVTANTGLLDYVTDPNGVTTDYTYNSNNDRLTAVTSGDSEVRYSYNISGQIATINRDVMPGYYDETVNYSFEYDSLGRRTCVYIGYQDIIGHFYDDYSGNVVQDYYANGFSKQYSYDDLDNITKIKYNNVDKFTWDYDYMGRVGLHNDLENNQEFRYTYDSKGRVESVVSKPTEAGFSKSTFKNTFNAKDQLSGVSRKVGGTTLTSTYTYTDGGRLSEEEYTNNSTLYYTYDDFGRIESKRYWADGNPDFMGTDYLYSDADEGETTTRVSEEGIYTADWSIAYGYSYDLNGNICEIKEIGGEDHALYEYDDLNQLTRAEIDGVTYIYEYGRGGNILSKYRGVDGTEFVELFYSDSNWQDLLTYYGEQAITYDEIGNPLTYRDGMSFTWQGRRLATANINGTSLSFKYNSDGIRTQKTVDGTTTYFTLDGSKIISQKTGNQEVFFEYDATGNLATMIYNGQTYYYVHNLMGEIIALVDEDGNLAVRYYYDPWGEVIGESDYTGENIWCINPFRYKDYYYDIETGLYYLNSRYYDPATSRFINADSVDVATATPMALTDKNLFAYCDNNPISRIDVGGEFWESAFDVVSLGASIVEVAINPSDIWSWAGLVGDVVDLIPFVTGVGEVTRAVKTTVKIVDDANEVASTARKIYNAADTASDIRKSTGSYEIMYKSGKNYVGKGGLDRAIKSAQKHSKSADDILSIRWKSAPTHRAAFIDEYLMQKRSGGVLSSNPFLNTYNKIWSPGRRYYGR